MKKLLSLVLLLPLLLCCGHGEFRDTLSRIDTLLHLAPKAALTALDSLSSSVNDMSRDERMHFEMYHRVAKVRNYVTLDGDSVARALADYFDRHGTANEKMMAYYVLGCAYRDIGDVPMQLESFQTAVEKADTTSDDCDYYTMVSIYGHMANIYDSQVLPEEEIIALREASNCARKDNDTLSVLKAYELLMRPYYLLQDTDKVLAIADTARVLYKQNGYNNLAAELLITPISISLDRGDYAKAKKYLDIYERESHLFDAEGNIKRGREYHYYNKGRYLLGIGDVDSAIYYFHRAIEGNINESGYKGILHAYKKKNRPDSIAKYSLLFAEANDSSWFAKNSQTVEQMTAMYDYSRHKKIAEENAVRAEHAEKTRTRLLLLLIFVAIASAYVFSKARKAYKKKISDKEKELQTLEEKYVEAMEAYTEADRDIRLLKLEYVERMETMKAEREKLENDIHQLSSQNSQLKEKIEEKVSALNKLEDDIREESSVYSSSLQEKNVAIEKLREDVISLTAMVKDKRQKNREQEFIESESYSRIKDVINPYKKADAITSAEWKLFTDSFCRCYPDLYTFLNVNHNLTPEQSRVCMLLKIGLSEGDMMLLMNVNNMRITRLKTQANKKLFGEDNAKTLRNNLKLKK